MLFVIFAFGEMPCKSIEIEELQQCNGKSMNGAIAIGGASDQQDI